MPSKPPPAPAKGTRHPGAGRKKGTPNRITVEARTLITELVGNANYQFRLRRDFARRKVHPTIESLVWQYHLGKPTQPIAMSGTLGLDVSARLEAERQAFAALDLADLEQLAAESQAVVDKALAKLRGAVASIPPLSPPENADAERKGEETLGNTAESDKGGYVAPKSPEQ